MTHTPGPWTATRGSCDGEAQTWFNVEGIRPNTLPSTNGEPARTCHLDCAIAMVFSAARS